ncbi:hypothetical protein GCM10007116_12530 [Sulfodiicoccus acidiphilus]|uniref:Uncharacterized protein n=1 Tax=Sulfodiicoccus acidiphilus TaxID=1670455 RepID=A0A830H1C0_9CREN|nr:hypothetical protein [Sulfodiicoccus acidiphilus]GGT96431.1 hypothetical protein GCM10007116_12530 [Sulfodiicoccus acidiphilus]
MWWDSKYWSAVSVILSGLVSAAMARGIVLASIYGFTDRLIAGVGTVTG